MDILAGFLIAAFLAVAAGLGASALIASRFPELKKERRPKERRPDDRDASPLEAIGRIGDRLASLLPAKAEDEADYRGKLARAGLSMSAGTWHGVQMLSAIVVGSLLTLLLVAPSDMGILAKALLAAASFAAGWFVPQVLLWARTNERTEEIDKELPSTLELLALSVKAGYPLTHGIKLVGKVGKGELAKEFRTVDADINLLGMDTARALERMRSRCGSDSVAAFSAAVVQAQRQGTAVTRILGSQAKLARDEQYAKTMQRINALANKMTPIVILVFIPLIVAIVLVPSFLNILSQMASF